jgi:hypothetical protein
VSLEAKWHSLAEQIAFAGPRTRFWLRDDDAIAPTPALDLLLHVTEHHHVPVALAIIPALTGQPLVTRIEDSRMACPVVHGWAHCNHAPDGSKKQELGLHRPLPVVLNELAAARQRMSDLFGGRLLAMLVPPWNRIAPELVPHLGQLGFRALSAFGPAAPAASVAVVNTQLDIMNWRGSRGCRDHGELIDALSGLIHQHDRDETPIGVLTHHLVHDDAAWDFLRRLFQLTEGRWLSAADAIVAAEAER